MKFLIDANLPFKLAIALRAQGFDTLHTDDLPKKERTTDKEIREIAILQNRVVITKDFDFLDSQILNNIPEKLLMVTTGNITNKRLLDIVEKNFESIVGLFEFYDLIEINNIEIIVHEK